MLPILLLGAALFILGSTDQPLWADEGWTIAATDEAHPLAVVSEWVAEDVHPPLFFMALNAFRFFIGDTLFEMRTFSIFLSLIGVAVAYRAGLALFGVRAGLFAGLFYALHDLVRALTHEVRHYPGQMLLATLAIWLYWRFYTNPTRGRGLAFVLAGAALIYTHYWGGLVLIGLAVHALMTHRDKLPALQRHIIAFAAIGLLYLLWLPVLYNQITLERPGGLPHALENNSTVYAVLTFQLIGIPELFWVVLAVVGSMAAFRARPLRWWPSTRTLAPLLVVLAVPSLSLLINLAYPTLSFRAMAVVVPAVILLAAHGLSQFGGREQAALLAFVLLFGLSTTSAGPVIRAPWPDVTDYLTAHTDSSDVVLLELDTDEYIVSYYLDQSDTATAYAHSETFRVQNPNDYDAFLAEHLRDADGVWVAKLGWPGLESEYDIRPDLAARGWVQSAPEIDQFGIYIDRPILLWRMDRPLNNGDADPVATYADTLHLLRATADVDPAGVTVNMLWQTDTPIEAEYTTSVLIFDQDGAVVTNQDGRPLAGLSPTSTWEPGRPYYDHAFFADLPPGDYRVGVLVYQFTDETFSEISQLTASDCSDDPACYYVIVDEVVIR